MPKSKMLKPILVGESNPYGGDPYFALYPAPDGCSGHRLCCLILGMRRVDYLGAFDRVNLCAGKWCIRDARDRADAIFCSSDRKIVALGSKVATAFGIKFRPFQREGESILVLPHPSGLSRAWNDPEAVARARVAVAEFLPELAHLLGVADGDE